MKFLLAIVRYAPLPVFVILAGVNFYLENMGAGHHGGHDEEMAPMMADGMAAHLFSPILGTMWLMYLLMGLAHAGPWFSSGRNGH